MTISILSFIKEYGSETLNLIRDNKVKRLRHLLDRKLRSKDLIGRLFTCNIKHKPSKKVICPIMLAARLPDPNMLQLMIEYGVDVNYIHQSYSFGGSNSENANRSMDAGAHAPLKPMSITTSREIAYSHQNRKIALSTPLHVATELSLYSNVELLLEKHANPDPRDHNGETPLHIAVRTGDIIMVRMLLYRGADTRNIDSIYNSPIHWATLYGHRGLVELLVKYDADIYQKSGNRLGGLIPIHIASREGHTHLIEYFSSYDKNSPHLKISCYGDTIEQMPIHLAALHGHIQCVEYMYEKHYVDLGITDSNYNTPLHLVLIRPHAMHSMQNKSKFIETAIYLINKCPESVNGRNNNGDTPLHLAAANSFRTVVEHLLKRDANPFSLNDRNLQPINYVSNEDPVTIQLLEMGMNDYRLKDKRDSTPKLEIKSHKNNLFNEKEEQNNYKKDIDAENVFLPNSNSTDYKENFIPNQNTANLSNRLKMSESTYKKNLPTNEEFGLIDNTLEGEPLGTPIESKVVRFPSKIKRIDVNIQDVNDTFEMTNINEKFKEIDDSLIKKNKSTSDSHKPHSDYRCVNYEKFNSNLTFRDYEENFNKDNYRIVSPTSHLNNQSNDYITSLMGSKERVVENIQNETRDYVLVNTSTDYKIPTLNQSIISNDQFRNDAQNNRFCQMRPNVEVRDIEGITDLRQKKIIPSTRCRSGSRTIVSDGYSLNNTPYSNQYDDSNDDHISSPTGEVKMSSDFKISSDGLDTNNNNSKNNNVSSQPNVPHYEGYRCKSFTDDQSMRPKTLQSSACSNDLSQSVTEQNLNSSVFKDESNFDSNYNYHTDSSYIRNVSESIYGKGKCKSNQAKSSSKHNLSVTFSENIKVVDIDNDDDIVESAKSFDNVDDYKRTSSPLQYTYKKFTENSQFSQQPQKFKNSKEIYIHSNNSNLQHPKMVPEYKQKPFMKKSNLKSSSVSTSHSTSDSDYDLLDVKDYNTQTNNIKRDSYNRSSTIDDYKSRYDEFRFPKDEPLDDCRNPYIHKMMKPIFEKKREKSNIKEARVNDNVYDTVVKLNPSQVPEKMKNLSYNSNVNNENNRSTIRNNAVNEKSHHKARQDISNVENEPSFNSIVDTEGYTNRNYDDSIKYRNNVYKSESNIFKHHVRKRNLGIKLKQEKEYTVNNFDNIETSKIYTNDPKRQQDAIYTLKELSQSGIFGESKTKKKEKFDTIETSEKIDVSKKNEYSINRNVPNKRSKRRYSLTDKIKYNKNTTKSVDNVNFVNNISQHSSPRHSVPDNHFLNDSGKNVFNDVGKIKDSNKLEAFWIKTCRLSKKSYAKNKKLQIFIVENEFDLPERYFYSLGQNNSRPLFIAKSVKDEKKFTITFRLGTDWKTLVSTLFNRSIRQSEMTNFCRDIKTKCGGYVNKEIIELFQRWMNIMGSEKANISNLYEILKRCQIQFYDTRMSIATIAKMIPRHSISNIPKRMNNDDRNASFSEEYFKSQTHLSEFNGSFNDVQKLNQSFSAFTIPTFDEAKSIYSRNNI
ncbi:putative ankyrin repeat protein [Intoshia linei]|uniref:Putative ankyrin repeat protein n=1 Tax=Intoshia linei TaxID=1819745 RepID=A0A177B405_9BILA|nr:putative ankyrin repeat protein [Intoshia linei]